MRVNVKKTTRVLFFILLTLTTLTFFLITPIDWTPYPQTSYYTHTKHNLDSVARLLSQQTQKDTLKTGWAQASITPAYPVPLTAYGQRGPYESIHDSVWVKAFIFTNRHRTVAFLTYDLYIVWRK